MPDTAINFGPSLQHLNASDWRAEVTDLLDDHGYMYKLGNRHMACFAEDSRTLLVTFETLQGIQTLSPLAHPLGWEMVKRNRWSHLGVICDGDTWFRDPAVFAHFDHLVDDGFFDEFDRVLFYGAGPCAYAAAAFSVAAPGARVLAIQPQATLAPSLSEWDTRFPHMRKTNFTDRFGYAPDMIDGAQKAFILYDPRVIEDAVHAALFNTPNITKLRMPNMGAFLQSDLLQMGIFYDVIEALGRDLLTPVYFAKLARQRRNHMPYLRRLMARLDAQERPELIKALCRNVTARHQAPRFARRLEAFNTEHAD